MKRVLVVVVVALIGCSSKSAVTPADVSESMAPDAQSDTGVEDFIDAARTPRQSATLEYPVDQKGPFGVGYRTFPHTYTPQYASTSRTIDIHLWYPTTTTEGEPVMYEALFPDKVSIKDAPLAAPVDLAGYPVHVFSHGHMGFGGNAAAVMQYFASHGWVVVAPDHTGNTLTDNIDPKPLSIYHWRPSDITATLNWLEALPDDEPLAGKALTDRVVMSGHSFGVHTCWATAGATFDLARITAECGDGGSLARAGCPDEDLAALKAAGGDKRIVASIPMAGSINRNVFGTKGHLTVAIPMLVMSGSEDPVGAEKQFNDTEPVDMIWIDLKGGCHQTFGLGACETLDPEEGFSLVNTYALAFARAHVLGDTEQRTTGILNGTIEISDKVVYKRREL